MSTTVAKYLMNPAEDVILFGDDIREGMLVLPERPDARAVAGRGEEQDIRAQRFCRVTRLARIAPRDHMGTRIRFVGEWIDGYQEVQTYSVESPFLVKKDSLSLGDGN